MREKCCHQNHLLKSFFWFRKVSGLVCSGYNRTVPKQMAQILSGSLACNSIFGGLNFHPNLEMERLNFWQEMKTFSFPSVVGEGLIPEIMIFLAWHK